MYWTRGTCMTYKDFILVALVLLLVGYVGHVIENTQTCTGEYHGIPD